MSRFLLSLSLITTLSSFAVADRAYEPHVNAPPSDPIEFAQPPSRGPRAMRAPVLDRARVRAGLARVRAKNLAAFRAYQSKGVFPNNTFGDTKLNVWRDDAGHLCAAATIIKMSGQTELVDRVADQTNFIRLADVTSGPLMDWILTSGFTQDEIAAIQEPFVPVGERQLMPVDPDEPVVVDARLRAAENRRLIAKYREVDAMLVKNANKDLDLATDRVMKRPMLAWSVVNS